MRTTSLTRGNRKKNDKRTDGEKGRGRGGNQKQRGASPLDQKQGGGGTTARADVY